MADNMTVEQRRRTMSRIRHSDTKPELVIRRLLFARGLRYRKCCRTLPGKPDLVFSAARLAVFVDGDFWHGWRFDEWSHKLTSPYWKTKIARNRERDVVNQSLLEQAGWRVIRIWEHEVKADPMACANRIEHAVRSAAAARKLLAIQNGRVSPPSKPPHESLRAPARSQPQESRRKL